MQYTLNPSSNHPSFPTTCVFSRKAGFLFREDLAPGITLEMTLNKIHHSTQSDYQQIDVIDTYFGKTLVTDGKTQSTQFDEFAYHESLVHMAMLNFAHYNKRGPKTVLIGGGGELATAREILRYTSVEKCVVSHYSAFYFYLFIFCAVYFYVFLQ